MRAISFLFHSCNTMILCLEINARYLLINREVQIKAKMYCTSHNPDP